MCTFVIITNGNSIRVTQATRGEKGETTDTEPGISNGHRWAS